MTIRAACLAAVLLALPLLACGHKGPPLPPPLKNPAPTSDLRIQQRGDELILKFTYPATTAGGLPLATIQKVEIWQLVKPLPPTTLDEEAAGEEETGEEEGGEEGEGAAAEGRETAAEAAGEEEAAGAEGPVDEAAEEESEEEDEEPAADPAVPLPPPPTKEQIAAVELLEFAATAQIRLVLEGEELSAATVGGEIVLRLPLGEPDEVETAYTYSIKTFADARRASYWSNLATLVRRRPLPPPERFAVEAQAGGVVVSWYNERAEKKDEDAEEEDTAASGAPGDEAQDEEDELKGFRVYRRDAQARVYPPSIAQLGPDADEYVDRSAQYGNRYIYSLTAVSLTMPLVESALAGEIEIDFQDRFAPPPPANPIALAEPGRVRLLWDASPAPDVRGYFVLRRRKGEDDFVRLNDRPIVDLEYSDRDVTAATDYEYQVRAVDRVGNEGEASAVAGARTP